MVMIIKAVSEGFLNLNSIQKVWDTNFSSNKITYFELHFKCLFHRTVRKNKSLFNLQAFLSYLVLVK